MVIDVNILNKHATVTGTPVIVCGNSDYVIRFTFDTEWDGLEAKTARFVYIQDGAVYHEDAPITDNEAKVPVLSKTKEVLIGVLAGNLSTSTPAIIPCEYSVSCHAGAPADPTPGQYEQIMELLAEQGDQLAAQEDRVNNTLANALKGNKSGEIVSMDDVSPIEHELNINVISKNVLQRPYESINSTNAGINYTINEDGSITASGTATGRSAFNFAAESPNYRKPIKKGTYTLSGCPAGGTQNRTTYLMVIGISKDNEYYDYGKGVTFTVKEDTTYYAYFVVYSGNTVDFTVYPQLELGTSVTEYAPYIPDISAVNLIATDETGKEQTYTPNTDGSVDGVKSLYPVTTLTTDTAGAVIEAEYNRDINKAFAELQQTVLSLLADE